jgi:hypothetical protein
MNKITLEQLKQSDNGKGPCSSWNDDRLLALYNGKTELTPFEFLDTSREVLNARDCIWSIIREHVVGLNGFAIITQEFRDLAKDLIDAMPENEKGIERVIRDSEAPSLSRRLKAGDSLKTHSKVTGEIVPVELTASENIGDKAEDIRVRAGSAMDIYQKILTLDANTRIGCLQTIYSWAQIYSLQNGVYRGSKRNEGLENALEIIRSYLLGLVEK